MDEDRSVAAASEITIAFNYGAEHAVLTFGGADEFYAWVKAESEFWSDLQQAASEVAGSLGRPTGNLFARERNFYSSLISPSKAFGSDPALGAQLESDIRELRDRLAAGGIFSAHLPPFLAISQALPTARAAAGIAGLASYDPTYLSWNNSDRIGLPARDVAFGLRLATPIKSFETDLGLTTVKAAVDSIREAHRDLAAKHSEAIDLLASLKNLEAQYHLKVAAASPIQFWKNRADGQATMADQAWTRFLLAIPVSAVAYLAALWFIQIKLSITDELHVLAIMVFPALMGLWILRHLARAYVQHGALRDDAAERATITETYVALASHPGVVPTPDERKMVVERLCRPGPGEVSDGLPHESLVKAAVQLVKK
jgi:hypothetical protein